MYSMCVVILLGLIFFFWLVCISALHPSICGRSRCARTVCMCDAVILSCMYCVCVMPSCMYVCSHPTFLDLYVILPDMHVYAFLSYHMWFSDLHVSVLSPYLFLSRMYMCYDQVLCLWLALLSVFILYGCVGTYTRSNYNLCHRPDLPRVFLLSLRNSHCVAFIIIAPSPVLYSILLTGGICILSWHTCMCLWYPVYSTICVSSSIEWVYRVLWTVSDSFYM